MKRELLFNYRDMITTFRHDPGNILEIQWRSLSLSLEDVSELWALFYNTLRDYSIYRILSDNSVAGGTISEEIFGYIENTMYPGLVELGIDKIGVVIPVNIKLTQETMRWESIYQNGIEVENFYTPSEALEWLLE